MKRVTYHLYSQSVETRFQFQEYATIDLPVGGFLFDTEITSIEDAPERLTYQKDGRSYLAMRSDLLTNTVVLDYEEIDDVEMSIDTSDAPDFCNCYVEAFTYKGRPATEDEVDALNDDDQFVYDQVISHLY
jgi:hypothetical protein